MTKSLLRISERDWQTLIHYHRHQDERISFLYGRAVRRKGRLIILAKPGPILPSDDCYHSAGNTHLELHKDVTAGLTYEFCQSDYDVLINIHSHPFSKSGTRFSGIDDQDDRQLDKFLRPKLAADQRVLTNLSIVVDQNSFDARFTDHRRKQVFSPLSEVQCFGEHLNVYYPNSRRQQASKRKHRQATASRVCRHDFIGERALSWMQQAKVAVCGAGGLGSIAAEGLLRLGFRKIVLIDDDNIELSNLNRLQTIKTAQLGHSKVAALKTNLLNMAADAQITAIARNISDRATLNILSSCDLLIGAVDNSLPRALLNHLSVQYQIPYFDAGVEITLNPVNLRYRLFSVLPAVTACMECSPFDILDNEEITQSLLSPQMQDAFRHLGYIREQAEGSAPSVYPLNMSAMGALLTELINYLGGFKAVATTLYSDYQHNHFQRSDRDNFPLNRPATDCPVCSFYRAEGDTQKLPFCKGTKQTIQYDKKSIC
ncbi:MAG: ThiF family adenylyltransferase [Cellvibrionaceae bacterium]|nr:ThiF family adenylyltransferase [Cellvibrionaceae bacterium]